MLPMARFPRRSALLYLTLFATILAPSLGCNRSAPAAVETAPPAAVKWEGPLRGALEEWTELVGTTVPLPDRIARVSAPVEGRVLSLLGEAGGAPVVEGQRVEKGAIIAQLDPTIVKANLAKVDAAQNVLREELRQTQLGVELAQGEVDRLRKLADEDARAGGRTPLVSPVDRLKADYALRDAQSKLKAAEGRLAAGAKEQEALQTQVKMHTLATPIGGKVGRVLVARGQSLSVGAPVAEIIDIDEQIDVLCFVPPSLIGKLQVGQAALTGGLDAGAGPTQVAAEGEIIYIAEQAEPETGSFAVKVRFPNKEAKLRSNRVLRVRVLTGPGRECLSLPEAAVQEDEEQPTVVVVTDVKVQKNADGKEETVGVARRLQVVLGVRDRTLHQVEIVRLDDPEKDPAKKWTGEVKDALFVVEGGHGLQTGDTVRLDVEAE